MIIGLEEIDHPEVISADVLVALSQEACDKYASNLKKTGLLIVDEEKVGRAGDQRGQAAHHPFCGRSHRPSRRTWSRWACWSG